MIRIIAVGKKHEAWVSAGIERYQERLRKPFDVEWVFLPHSQFEGDRARQEESERILARLGDDEAVLLDERGRNYSSPELSELLTSPLEAGQRVTLIIGGAYGVDASVHARVQAVWSLSRLVFPHQLVRLLVAEQLYRAQAIRGGLSYHHE